MDDWSRIIIALIFGVAAALAISYFFGDLIFWLLICVAISLATETSLRTIKNVKAPQSPVLDSQDPQLLGNEKNKLPKQPKANF